MFDNKKVITINISLPSQPYPKCECGGVLLPNIDFVGECYNPGRPWTAHSNWTCNKCLKRF